MRPEHLVVHAVYHHLSIAICRICHGVNPILERNGHRFLRIRSAFRTKDGRAIPQCNGRYCQSNRQDERQQTFQILLIHFFPFKVIYSLFFNTSRQTVSSLYSKKKSVASFATDFFENLRFSYFSFFSEESSPEAYAPTIFQESSSCFFSFSWISCFSSPVSSTFLENASSISGIISAYTFFINAF